MVISEEKVRSITDSNSLFAFMSRELGWELPSPATVDELTFEWTGSELNLSEDVTCKLKSGRIRQIQPLRDGQPWGIFLVDFATPHVYTTALRQLLRRLVRSRRMQSPNVPAWQCDDLLFICTSGSQEFTFAHFSGDKPERAKITTFGWAPQEPVHTLCELNLPALRYDYTWDDDMWLREWQKAFDVEKVTRRFFEEYRRVFERVEARIKGFDNRERKRLFTQRLFNRLLFIAFIQKKRWLRFDSQTKYLAALWSAYSANPTMGSNFYRDRLMLLFFCGLNTPNDVNIVDIDRDGPLKSLIGDVPYLNGGLFEEDDDDRNPDVLVPDECIGDILTNLFNRFNFTVTESTPLDVEVAVDPEMLGKVFEELVTGRHETGSYYTPKTVVSFMCREAIKGCLGGYEELVDDYDSSGVSVQEARELLRKLTQITVCDPACGSGAYLVGMLHELQHLHGLLDTRAEATSLRDNYQRKLEIIQNNLYGVDIDSFAVNIARLRLWLSLAVEYPGQKPEPLPNLDFKIEVGDSLTAPDPQAGIEQGFRSELIKQFRDKKAMYLQAHSAGEKQTLRQEIIQLRKQIGQWTRKGKEVAGFDWAVEFVEVFAKGGFDIAIANPPYGLKCEDPLRFQYFPRHSNREMQGRDSYGLFVARALQLLKPGGFLTFIISDTWRTIRSHYRLRARLLEGTTILHVIDLPPWIFEATVNTCILSVRSQTALESHKIITVDLRNLPAGSWSALEANLAAVSTQIPDVQTTTYARYTYAQGLIPTYANLSFFVASPSLYRLLSDERFSVLGNLADIKQGLATADNKHYLRKEIDAHGGYDLIDRTELLTERDIGNLTEGEKRNGVDPAKYGGRHFVPYDKGGASDADAGWLPNYFVPTQYFIDWSEDAVRRLHTATIADVKRSRGETNRIRRSDQTTRAAVVRNLEYYFREGLTASRVGIYSPTFRVTSMGPFDSGCSNIFFFDINSRIACGVMCSTLLRYLFLQFLNHTVNSQVDDLKDLPMSEEICTDKGIEALVLNIIDRQGRDHRYPYHLYEQKRIDAIVYRSYGLTDEDVREVELWYCRRYPKLAEAQGVLAEVREKYSDYLARCELILSKPATYWKSHPILQLIARGEDQGLEFKETLEADAQTGENRAGVLISSLRTIAGFLNASGGTLLIGVSDSGEIKNLEKDLRLSPRHNADGFQQKLRSLIRDRLEPDPIGKISIEFEHLREGIICRVTVEPSEDVVCLDGKDVYVRDGNTTRRLEGPALVNWIRARNSKTSSKQTGEEGQL